MSLKGSVALVRMFWMVRIGQVCWIRIIDICPCGRFSGAICHPARETARELPETIDIGEGVNVRRNLIAFSIIALCLFVTMFAAGCVVGNSTEPETAQWRFAVFCDNSVSAT